MISAVLKQHVYFPPLRLCLRMKLHCSDHTCALQQCNPLCVGAIKGDDTASFQAGKETSSLDLRQFCNDTIIHLSYA